MEIPILISILTKLPQKKLNSPSQSTILRDFQNQEYRFITPKSRTQLTEKQEEYRQLQSVMRFSRKYKQCSHQVKYENPWS